MVYNGKLTPQWLNMEDSSSPTTQLETIMIIIVIAAKECQDVITADVPSAFIQAHVEPGEECVIMKITGLLVNFLVVMAPEVYGPYVVYENGNKILYVQVLKALYGMLVAALLRHKKFRADLEEAGFIFNPYDPCVANRQVNGKQQLSVSMLTM